MHHASFTMQPIETITKATHLLIPMSITFFGDDHVIHTQSIAKSPNASNPWYVIIDPKCSISNCHVSPAEPGSVGTLGAVSSKLPQTRCGVRFPPQCLRSCLERPIGASPALTLGPCREAQFGLHITPTVNGGVCLSLKSQSANTCPSPPIQAICHPSRVPLPPPPSIPLITNTLVSGCVTYQCTHCPRLDVATSRLSYL